MDNRELYKLKVEAEIHEWTAKLEVLEAKSEKLSIRSRIEMQRQVDAFRDKLGLVKEKLHAIGDATAEQWDGVVSGLDQAWGEAKGAAAGAYDALTGRAAN